MIVEYPEYQACVQPSLDIILRIIKVKKNEIQDLIDILNSEKFLNILKMIMVIHECNMKIINELLLIFFQIGEKAELKSFLCLFSFRKLREIFNIFKMNGFDYIHEIIIRLLRHIIIRKLNSNNPNNLETSNSKKLSANKNEPKNENKKFLFKNLSNQSINNSINDSNNKIYISTEENEIDSIYSITNDDFAEINFILLTALQFINNKINMYPELLRNAKSIINLITNLNFMLDSLLNVISKMPNKIKIIQNIKLLDSFLNLICLLNEKKFFSEMERFYSSNDPNLVNNKVIALKLFSNIQKLSRSIKESHQQFKVIFTSILLFFLNL